MRIVRTYWMLVLGLVVFSLGLASEIPFWSISGAASFGWTAYAPLTSTTFSPAVAPIVPVFELAIGLGLIGAWIGYRVGRSRTQKPAEH